MKLAVMTWYHYRNYGTALQAAALTSVLRELGHEPELIRYKPCGYYRTVPDYSVPAFSKRVFQKLKRRSNTVNTKHFCDAAKDKLFEDFLNTHITFTNECTTKADLECLNGVYDAFICGSDQIWSPLNFDPKYFLDFVRNPAKKIAYAPSMGVDKMEDPYIRAEIAKLLHLFGSLSVREAAGQRLIKELSGRDAQIVLDPTLLLTAAQWKDCFDWRTNNDEQAYLLAYMLGNNPLHWEGVRKTAAHMGLKLRLIPVFQNDLSREGCVKEPIGPEAFLKLLHNAAYVCTDSFHGMIFSLLFHKPFTAIARFESHDTQNQNSRMFHLLNMTSMRDRLAESDNWEKIADAAPDFNKADCAIEKRRSESLRYLTNALLTVGQDEKKMYAVMQQNSLCCGCGACRSVCPVSAIRLELDYDGFWEAVIDGKKCIHCGKCKAVCPFCAEKSGRAVGEATLFSYKCNDAAVLEHSTSGGAAHNIAKLLLSRGYDIVGCQYNIAQKRAEHIIVRDETRLSALQGSKYIQSYFADALDMLKHETKPAAVFGTPCQIAAAKKVLAERTNVIYIDLVCHGVPSTYLFHKYQKHIHDESGVDTSNMTMDFRYKPKGWADIHLHATDGVHEYCCDKTEDPFFRMFEMGACYNEACYECRWRRSSEADIRLGDYWGPRFKTDTTGVSMAVCFTQNGFRILEDLRLAEAGIIQKQPLEDYLTYQQKSNIPKPVFYDAVIQSLRNEKRKLTDIADKYAFPFENRRLSKKEHLRYIYKMLTFVKNKKER